MKSLLKHSVSRLSWMMMGLIGFGSLGCGGLPSNEIAELNVAGDLVDDSFDGTEWNYGSERFAVDAPSALTFAERLDKELLAANWDRGSLPATPAVMQSPDMPDMVFAFLESLTRPVGKPNVELRIPLSSPLKAMHMSGDSSFLLVVTDRIEVWNLLEEDQVTKVDSAISGVTAAFISEAGERVYLCTKEAISSFDVATGILKNRWRPAGGEVLSVDYAEEAGKFVVAVPGRKAVILDSELNDEMQLDFPADTSRVRIDPKGKLTVVVDEVTTIQRLDKDQNSPGQKYGNKYLGLEVNPETILLDASPTRVLRIVDDSIHVVNLLEENARVEGMDLNATVIDAFSAWGNDGADWACLLAERIVDKKPEYIIVDVAPSMASRGEVLALGSERPLGFSAVGRGKSVAVAYPTHVDFFHRRPWVEWTDKSTTERPYFFLRDVDLKALDLYVSEIFNCGRLATGHSGSELHSLCVSYTVQWIVSRMNYQGSKATFGGWFESGSNFARQVELLVILRTSPYLLEGQSPAASQLERQLAKILEEEPDSLASYMTAFQWYQRDWDVYSEVIDETLLAAVNRFPYSTILHATVCDALLKSDQFSVGASNAYLNDVLNQYPKQARDRLYAESALDLFERYDIKFFNNRVGYNFKRLARGLREVVRYRRLEPKVFWDAVNIAVTTGDDVLLKALEDHQFPEQILSFSKAGAIPTILTPIRQMIENAVKHSGMPK